MFGKPCRQVAVSPPPGASLAPSGVCTQCAVGRFYLRFSRDPHRTICRHFRIGRWPSWASGAEGQRFESFVARPKKPWFPGAFSNLGRATRGWSFGRPYAIIRWMLPPPNTSKRGPAASAASLHREALAYRHRTSEIGRNPGSLELSHDASLANILTLNL